MNNFQNLTNNTNLLQLNSEHFYDIFKAILSDQFSEEQILNFLVELNHHNLPTPAFIGAVKALKEEMITIQAPKNCLDLCGTGGDQLNTLNISSATCFVVAGANVCVAKHGNKAISSKSGSADIFFELGIKISDKIDILEKNLFEKNLAFLFAVDFHPALKKLAPIRKKLSHPTIFNYLGPLLSPANCSVQLIGTSRYDTMIKIANVLAQNPKNHAFIVHGFDGMDEITLTNKTHLLEVENGKVNPQIIIDPQDFNLKLVDLKELQGFDPKNNAQKLLALLNGEKSAYRDIVVLNSAFALLLVKKVKTVQEGIDLAQKIIDQKQALAILESLRN